MITDVSKRGKRCTIEHIEQDANVNISLLFTLFVPSLGFYSRSVASRFSFDSFKAGLKLCSCLCVYLSQPVLKCADEMLLTHSVWRVTPHYTHLHSHPFFSSTPGSQLYHSVICVFVQFLMLRLMGRTVTGVLCSFTFQMVRRFSLNLFNFAVLSVCTYH